jgi:hypothetical protein
MVAQVNYKKEFAVASLLAMTLAAGLGTISFGLFSEAPPQVKLKRALDVFTDKGGSGINVSGGDFEPYDNVPLYAYVTEGGAPVTNEQVTFMIKKPDGTEKTTTAQTNDSGIAVISLSLLPSESHVIGTWQILANNSAGNEVAEDELTIRCKSENSQIDVFSKKNGAFSDSFLPSDNVFVEARLLYKSAPIADAPVIFEVKTPNETDITMFPQTVFTDNSGSANVTFQIPWPSQLSLGTWQISATSSIFEQPVNATTNFACSLVPPMIDVYTQKGGGGQNMPGGIFAPNETVVIYAEIRDSLNHSVPNELVAFEVKQYNGTLHYAREQTTDDTGIVNISQSISPDPSYFGIYEVYVSAVYDGNVLLDTLTFIAQQS